MTENAVNLLMSLCSYPKMVTCDKNDKRQLSRFENLKQRIYDDTENAVISLTCLFVHICLFK